MNHCLLCDSCHLQIRDSQAVYCNACGILINSNARPLDYAEGGGQAPPDDSKKRWRIENGRMRLALIAPFVDHHSDFIDIGCGSGETLEAASAFFAHRIGFDTNPALISHVRECSNATVFRANFDNTLISNLLSSYGKVFAASHVLEHLEHPLVLTDEIVAAMSPGDLLYIEVPLHTGQSFRDFGYDWSLWNHEHMALYAMHSLDFISRHTGLQVLHRGTRIFARGSKSGSTRLRLLIRSPFRFLKTVIRKGRHSIADVMVADYGCIVLRKN